MFVEPPIKPGNTFEMIDFEIQDDNEFQCHGLSSHAKKVLEKCDKTYFILATGVTGRGKSTTLSQLINPSFGSILSKDKNIFVTGDGADSVTGNGRTEFFPTFGPVRLSTFCEKWKIPEHDEDQNIALVFIDSQGTKSFLDKGVHIGSGITSITAALGLRLCMANWGRPSTQDFQDVSGGLAMNYLVKGESTCGYSIAIIHPNVYNQYRGSIQEHEAYKEKKNQKYEKLWREKNPRLENLSSLKVMLCDDPQSLNEGYWNSLKELALWIADLARRNNQPFKTLKSLVESSLEYLAKFGIEDDADIDAEETITKCFTKNIEEKVKEYEIIDDNQETKIHKILKPQIDEMKIQSFFPINENSKETSTFDAKEQIKKELQEFAKSFMPALYEEESIQKVINQQYEYLENTLIFVSEALLAKRRNKIITEIKDKILEQEEAIFQQIREKSYEDINSKPFKDVSMPDLLVAYLKRWISDAKSRYEAEILPICFDDQSIKNDLEIKSFYEDWEKKLELNLEAKISQVFQEWSQTAHKEMLKEEHERANEELVKQQLKHEEELRRQEEDAKAEKEKLEAHLKLMEENYKNDEAELIKLKESSEKLQKELTQKLKAQEEEFERKQNELRAKHEAQMKAQEIEMKKQIDEKLEKERQRGQKQIDAFKAQMEQAKKEADEKLKQAQQRSIEERKRLQEIEKKNQEKRDAELQEMKRTLQNKIKQLEKQEEERKRQEEIRKAEIARQQKEQQERREREERERREREERERREREERERRERAERERLAREERERREREAEIERQRQIAYYKKNAPLNVGQAVNLVNGYYGTSYGENGWHTAACGWAGLYVGARYSGRKGEYRIDRNGVGIGFAPRSSIEPK